MRRKHMDMHGSKGKCVNTFQKAGIHRLLGVLFSKDIVPSLKCEILGNEFEIPMTTSIEEVNTMCNLSEYIFEQAINEGLEKGRLELLCDLVKEGTLSEETAALKAAMSLSEFKDVLKQYALN